MTRHARSCARPASCTVCSRRTGRDRGSGKEILERVAAQALARRAEQLLDLEIDLGGLGQRHLEVARDVARPG